MSRSALRRGLAITVLSSSAVLGLLTATSTAHAQPDVRDRVFVSQSGGVKTVLTPDRSASGAPVRQVPRIGVADATPPEQTWRQESARQGRGAFTLVHTPTAAGPRKLCLDVQGDSTAAGAPLVLRPCDGTDSQAWKFLTNSVFTQLENQDSKLKVELVNGRLVQADFPQRDAADARQRRTAQFVGLPPKTFGIGGI